ncbi:unnamed protein product [Leuciscus chuanchicus]
MHPGDFASDTNKFDPACGISFSDLRFGPKFFTLYLKHSKTDAQELKGRWHDFCQKVQFFGVWKKALKPPMGMDKAEQALEILRVLPSLFPSTSVPPQRVRDASKALVHVLKETEDPNSYLKESPLSCPVLIVSPSNFLLAEGDVAITTFPKDKLTESALYLMAYYYTLHLMCSHSAFSHTDGGPLRQNP